MFSRSSCAGIMPSRKASTSVAVNSRAEAEGGTAISVFFGSCFCAYVPTKGGSASASMAAVPQTRTKRLVANLGLNPILCIAILLTLLEVPITKSAKTKASEQIAAPGDLPRLKRFDRKLVPQMRCPDHRTAHD